jgi:hypothetical protein
MPGVPQGKVQDEAICWVRHDHRWQHEVCEGLLSPTMAPPAPPLRMLLPFAVGGAWHRAQHGPLCGAGVGASG